MILIEEVHIKRCRVIKPDAGPKVRAMELRKAHVQQRVLQQEKVCAGNNEFFFSALFARKPRIL